jgi:hypothetical protein
MALLGVLGWGLLGVGAGALGSRARGGEWVAEAAEALVADQIALGASLRAADDLGGVASENDPTRTGSGPSATRSGPTRTGSGPSATRSDPTRTGSGPECSTRLPGAGFVEPPSGDRAGVTRTSALPAGPWCAPQRSARDATGP